MVFKVRKYKYSDQVHATRGVGRRQPISNAKLGAQIDQLYNRHRELSFFHRRVFCFFLFRFRVDRQVSSYMYTTRPLLELAHQLLATS